MRIDRAPKDLYLEGNDSGSWDRQPMVEIHESVQIALFLRSAPTLDALTLWRSVSDASPSGFQTTAPGQSQAQGEIDQLQMQLIVQAARVDLVINGLNPAPHSGEINALPSFDSGIAAGLNQVTKIITHITVGRVAAVLQGTTFAASKEDAVLRTSALVPSLPLPNNSIDINYQVIVPRQSSISSARRLQQIFRVQSVQMQFLEMHNQGLRQTSGRFGAHAYIDVFGDAIEALDSDQALQAVYEVSEIAANIMKGGYDAIR